jgi:crotonobetaine/carnitine-CoA ligase
MNLQQRPFSAILDIRVDETPHRDAILFVDGETWTWRDLQREARSKAAGLQRLGVGQGDYVLSWMPNCPTSVATIFALSYLGAIYVPVNTSYRGAMLAHVIRTAGARHMILHAELFERLAEIDTGQLEDVIVMGGTPTCSMSFKVHGAEALGGDADALLPPARAVEDWDTQMVIFTSGTTGPSKAVLASYRHARSAALGFRNVGPGDRNLTAMPLYHVGGIYGLFWALFHGGSAVVADGFSTGAFWSVVERYGVTTTGLLGSMVDFLNGLPPSPGDKNHSLKTAVIAPYGVAAMQFAERFGVRVYTEFNMSELAVPLFCGPDPAVVGTCGLPSPGTQLRLVDAFDEEVADGAVGELIVRMDMPWTISHGYLNDDRATAATWRNGWFHTGDMFRCDAQGHYHFVDRAKDAIRRRGENISSFEVENALMSFAGVMEAAAIGVPASDGAEQEVMAVLKVDAPQAFDPAALISFLENEIAHFMIPRFVRLVEQFPRTPTLKIEKHRLRSEGVTPQTWDREAAGIKIRRMKLKAL